ncbi:CPBP family intramembrane metalloprotease [Microbacterium luteolum]|uniref:CPBP family intramembrane metalloprotease n=1 Tax=Microbacterium luteolum TaxID=69367 RepID=A0ABY7XSX0_MICLT|nr:CPBP family intramembrane glutamic endopeptidase [Microbacterium luteolum]WDM45220.1 CPBP family intramembrane metalloprotease [Microbacterium luteolum]
MNTSTSPRRLRVWHYLVIVAVYIAIVQATGIFLTAGQDVGYAQPTSVDYLIRSYVIPVGLGILFAIGITGYLGRWQEIFVEGRRFRRWTLVVPAIVLVCALIITNYSGLGEKGIVFALLLFISTMMVGFGEELVFRGIGVSAFRDGGFSEFKVGLWTTVIFGLAHGTNIFVAGPQALVQVVATTATGFVFYLVLRSTGALVIAMAAHGLWDFSVISTQVNPDSPSPLANIAGVALAVVLLIAVLARKRLNPAGAKSA